ncbi:MAG: glycoside hydrolase family 3 C-terminal domain-containing protein [Bacteroidales bacterium]|nr:glycoside hydrolase family 3 C-terminal domain-containing protein [Bacteroidales bacterium]
MTTEEKVACLSTDPSVLRLGIKGTRHVEGLHGLAQGGPSNWGRRNPAPTTIFPQAIGLAESWDIEMIYKVASIEGYEVRYMFQNEKYNRGGLVVRAPNADLGRDPRWGRTEECFGEDAWFNAQMVIAFIKGLQGDDPKYWLTASLMKHFLANSNEDGRDSTSSDFSDRLFREYYSYPFYKGITEGGSRAYMTAYNACNGIPCIIHPVIKEITMQEWGQDGITCTDGGAFRLLVNKHRAFLSFDSAASACIKTGTTQFLDKYQEGVNLALKKGLISEADIDSALWGNFRVMIKLGQLDPPEIVPYRYIGIRDSIEPWLTKAHQNTALEATLKTIVLLKNNNNILPVDQNTLKSVAIIGPKADSVLLDWYSGTPPYKVSILEGIRKEAGSGIEVNFARDNTNGKAVELAKKSDIVILVVGNHPLGGIDAPWGICYLPSDGREAVDRKSINLEQEGLIKQVFEVNPKTIVILVSSFPYAINWTNENVPAIIHMTHCSQESGNALADVVFGKYNPAGRLVQTWPKSIEDLPEMMDYDITKGRTYMYSTKDPLYEFGYGLSYTGFTYSNLTLNSEVMGKENSIAITCDIKNIGKYAGDEVVQLYVQHLNSKVTRPIKELRGFQRINIQPGETKSVHFTLHPDDLMYWDETLNQFYLENDEVQIMIGASSSDIRLTVKISVLP